MEYIPFKYREAYKLLCRFSDNLHELIEDGSFFTLSWRERRKLTRRIKRLYNRLSGPVPVAVLKPVVALAGVAALIGCDTGGGGGGGDDGGPVADNPSFAAPVADPFDFSAAPRDRMRGLELADLDGDGDLDLLYFQNPDGVSIDIVLNEGTPNDPDLSSPPLISPYGVQWRTSGTYTYTRIDSITFGDLDDDGDLDAVALGYYSYVPPRGMGTPIYAEGAVVVINEPNSEGPSFDSASVADYIVLPSGAEFASLDVQEVHRPTLVDIDDDGDLDLFFGARDGYTRVSGGAVLFSENEGTPSAPNFAAPQRDPFSITLPSYTMPTSINTVDIDGDGDSDLIIGIYDWDAGSYGVGWFENSGSADAPSFTAFASDPFGLTSDISAISNYSLYSALAIGDIDGDGDLDVFTGSTYDYDNSSYPLVFQENENF